MIGSIFNMIDSTIDDTLRNHLTPLRIFAIVFFGMILLTLAPMLLFPFRNWKPTTVAERFLKNCPEIKAEAGEITTVGRFDVPSRSQEIARRLQAGESLSEVGVAKDGENSRFSLLPAGMTLERLKVSGSKREVEAEVSLEKGYMGDYDTSVYYVVTGVKFRDEGGNWINVPIGWTDNYFLLFK